MTARLAHFPASNLDASWIGREMIVDGTHCGVLSDVERVSEQVWVYLSGSAFVVAADAVVTVDTLAAR